MPHGFPASSFMFRDLIPRLGRNDPGFGPEGSLAFAADADHVRPFPRKDTVMTGSLKDQSVLVVGRGSGLARAIALAARDAGARVIAAGRDAGALAAAYAGEPGISTETVDLTDEDAIAALAERLGSVDHVVSTASARARGRLADLDRDAIRRSFDTKVTGPLMLAKHLAPRMNGSGSFVIFSGVAAAKIAVGTLGVAITNAAADTLARSLALELAPIRVNAISPGVIDTGAWDAFGEQGKADYFAKMSAANPARRIGTPDDIAQAVLFAMTSTFLTGQTLHIDGGEPLT
jgi:NAD(P)-dependent dehydrogenase (short-subunit alcohol dehydrogenase family)